MSAQEPATVTFTSAIPILRIFDERKAREFYIDFLGFSIEFEHRFEADLPLYLGISRNGLNLHLSEHHGDACPGAAVFIPTQNIEQLRDELIGKQYGYARPDIVQQGWGKPWKSATRSVTGSGSARAEKPALMSAVRRYIRPAADTTHLCAHRHVQAQT